MLLSQAGFSPLSWAAGSAAPLTQPPLTQAPFTQPPFTQPPLTQLPLTAWSDQVASPGPGGGGSSEGPSHSATGSEGMLGCGLPPAASYAGGEHGSESDDDDPMGLQSFDVLASVRHALS